jgi:hypothetical protein
VLAEYGVTQAVTGEDARPAKAVLHFLRLMREYGPDPAAVVNKLADVLRKVYRKEHRRRLPEAELRTELRRWLGESCYFIYLFGPVVSSDGPRANYSPVKYTGGHRAEVLASVRAAAANRRRNREAAHPTDCAERQTAAEVEGGSRPEGFGS